ncbi:hypothetical protein CKA32_004455 [Geitlerinema sp. FC II]|nr:hypothetical protein CKA32_004455 [Geitlerinema sp. FC II]
MSAPLAPLSKGGWGDKRAYRVRLRSVEPLSGVEALKFGFRIAHHSRRKILPDLKSGDSFA